MMRKTSYTTATVTWVSAIILAASMASSVCARPIPAFPGAEGYGAKATGGRDGRVIKVTNLNESGPGSLQAACEAEGPRIVVFEVSGTIDGVVDIENDDITIAGQTAPGDGIAIKGQLGIDGDNGIISSPSDVGGWPELESLPAPEDSDGNGMPDKWEETYGLDPQDASDGSKDKDSDGYTKPENNVNTLH